MTNLLFKKACKLDYAAKQRLVVKRKSLFVLVIILTTALFNVAKVNAALIDYTLDFEAVDLNDRFNRVTPPVDPVIGSFIFSLDKTLGDTTIFPTFFALNIAVDFPIEILYSSSIDRIIIGGGSASTLRNFTNDFIFIANSFSTSPSSTRFEYCVASGCNGGPFRTTQVNLSISASSVPEPGMLPIFLAGILAFYVYRRRFSAGRGI